MAKVHLELARAGNTRAVSSEATMQVPSSSPRASETLTSSAANQISTVAAQPGEVWSVSAKGGSVYVAFGLAPDATAGSRRVVQDGQTRDFGALAAGEKIAISDFS